ncbi:uncharacterized protein BYT42DRAFT_548573 [Radiomyces spectabilis]|uniref:uncharacterized protein n=1 Tax=Radiomyces spectabilis TaxID=64574 RepID=UPI00221FDE9C|nr:uncharacterized protein BYT42DRAFT_548573 [Radiomyces spectabilis]KAI8371760.1 hypothetical protein BYT42DRAFT_548573 [Radiomyces spectabilis]
MQMHNNRRGLICDGEAWLQNNYEVQNGLPNFFRERSYTFAMKTIAEKDYITVVDVAAEEHEDVAFHEWAINMKMNQYRRKSCGNKSYKQPNFKYQGSKKAQKQVFETIIQKFKCEEDDKKYLAKVIKEADEAKSDKVIKKIYSQILETMLYDQYLFTEQGCSDADYLVKLQGPIMETIFCGSGCKVIWLNI